MVIFCCSVWQSFVFSLEHVVYLYLIHHGYGWVWTTIRADKLRAHRLNWLRACFVLFFKLPLATTVLLSVSMSLATWDTLHKWSLVYLSCDWLISFSIVSSRFIRVVASDRISYPFFRLNNITCMYVPHFLFLIRKLLVFIWPNSILLANIY